MPGQEFRINWPTFASKIEQDAFSFSFETFLCSGWEISVSIEIYIHVVSPRLKPFVLS